MYTSPSVHMSIQECAKCMGHYAYCAGSVHYSQSGVKSDAVIVADLYSAATNSGGRDASTYIRGRSPEPASLPD